MANIYVNKYKETIVNYHKKLKSVNDKMKAELQRYSAEYAEKVSAEYEQQKQQIRNEAVQSVTRQHDSIIDSLAVSSFPNVEQLTADRMIFENLMIDLSVPEVKSFIERYNKNPLMLRIIQNWLKVRHNADSWKSEYKSAYDSIVTPQDKAEAYKVFAVGAINLINQIYDNPDISTMLIDSYGDENVGADLYRKIGDGMEISLYTNKKVSDSVRDSFSSYHVSEADFRRYSNTYTAE